MIIALLAFLGLGTVVTIIGLGSAVDGAEDEGGFHSSEWPKAKVEREMRSPTDSFGSTLGGRAA